MRWDEYFRKRSNKSYTSTYPIFKTVHSISCYLQHIGFTFYNLQLSSQADPVNLNGIVNIWPFT